MTDGKIYIAIDLKSFYASVECVERGLDPLDANLVVADESRTEKTICLAVSPALKSIGVPGRARLFEAVQRVKAVNAERLRRAPGRVFTGKSHLASELRRDRSLELDFVVAKPRMSKYMDISARIFDIYMRRVAPDDIHVYSVDEVFIDATPYLRRERMTAREFAMRLIRDVLNETGITATAGIGTNLFLAKIAMDIVAKRIPADRDGVRIAELDERKYREEIWGYRPLTDIWRVGKGTADRLASMGIYTMGDVARRSVCDEEGLYRMFGVNAELLIDHAWGWEPCTIADIKAFRPENNSISTGQVLRCPYDFTKGRLVVREMADSLALDLAEKRLVTGRIDLTVGYDIENLSDPDKKRRYKGAVTRDRYGREVPKAAHGAQNLPRQTASTKLILEAVTEIYERVVDPGLLVRRMYLAAEHVVPEDRVSKAEKYEQLDLLVDYEAEAKKRAEEEAGLEREKRRQQAVLDIRRRFGKNAILKGMDLEDGATAVERNGQVGGHKA